MAPEIVFFILVSIGLSVSIVATFITERLTKALYEKYREIWVEMGSPGGLFWRPPGRGIWENLMITGRFWRNNAHGPVIATNLPEIPLGRGVIKDKLKAIWLWHKEEILLKPKENIPEDISKSYKVLYRAVAQHSMGFRYDDYACFCSTSGRLISGLKAFFVLLKKVAGLSMIGDLGR